MTITISKDRSEAKWHLDQNEEKLSESIINNIITSTKEIILAQLESDKLKASCTSKNISEIGLIIRSALGDFANDVEYNSLNHLQK